MSLQSYYFYSDLSLLMRRAVITQMPVGKSTSPTHVDRDPKYRADVINWVELIWEKKHVTCKYIQHVVPMPYHISLPHTGGGIYTQTITPGSIRARLHLASVIRKRSLSSYYHPSNWVSYLCCSQSECSAKMMIIEVVEMLE